MTVNFELEDSSYCASCGGLFKDKFLERDENFNLICKHCLGGSL